MTYIKKSRSYFKGSQVRKGDRQRLLSIGCCMYCGDTELLEIEHILACSNGGKSTIDNMTVACSRCNSQKGSFPLDVFLARIILKRDKVFNKVYYNTHILRQRKRRTPIPELEEQCRKSILEIRLLHSYYTRIIHSIIHKKYIIHL